MSWQPPWVTVPPLIQAIRDAEGMKGSLVTLHAFFLIAARPMTLGELAAAMKCSKGAAQKATERYCRVALPEGGIREPELHLFNRKHEKTQGGTTYKLSLTKKARELLRAEAEKMR